MDSRWQEAYDSVVSRVKWIKTVAKRRAPAFWKYVASRWYVAESVHIALATLLHVDACDDNTGANVIVCLGDGRGLRMARLFRAIVKPQIRIVCVDPTYATVDVTEHYQWDAKDKARFYKRVAHTQTQCIPLGVAEWLEQAIQTREWHNMHNVVIVADHCHAEVNKMGPMIKRCFAGAHTLVVGIAPCCKFSSLMRRETPLGSSEKRRQSNAETKRLQTRVYKLRARPSSRTHK